MYRLFRAPRGLRGKLFKLTGPIFLETLLMLTLGVVDTLMLSRCGESIAEHGIPAVQYYHDRNFRHVRPLFRGEGS